METKIVGHLAGKLGLRHNKQVIEKSTELLRLLQIKSTNIASQLGDYAKVVICIDLATGILGISFDTELGLKVSSLKKSTYLNNRRILEKLLDINKPVGIYEICVQLGITQVQEKALKLLDKYSKSLENNMQNVDISHPQYAAMAVYQACKLQKLKIQKTKLITYSHLKITQWNLLEKSWDKWMEIHWHSKKMNEDIKNDMQNNPTKSGSDPEMDDCKNGKKLENGKYEIENYEEWKTRVLKKAYAVLASVERLEE